MSKTAYRPVEIPVGDHWAIITFGSISIPGDERSRTNPGHGYPESTEITTAYEVFTSEAEWKAEIAARSSRPFSNQNFVALIVKRPTLKTITYCGD